MNPVDLLGAKISIRVRIRMTHPYIIVIIKLLLFSNSGFLKLDYNSLTYKLKKNNSEE